MDEAARDRKGYSGREDKGAGGFPRRLPAQGARRGAGEAAREAGSPAGQREGGGSRAPGTALVQWGVEGSSQAGPVKGLGPSPGGHKGEGDGSGYAGGAARARGAG